MERKKHETVINELVSIAGSLWLTTANVLKHWNVLFLLIKIALLHVSQFGLEVKVFVARL